MMPCFYGWSFCCKEISHTNSLCVADLMKTKQRYKKKICKTTVASFRWIFCKILGYFKANINSNNVENILSFHQVSPAAERLRYILNEDDDMPTPTLFTEMDTLQREGDELEWKESARWMTLKQTTEGKYKTNCVLFLVGWFRMSSCKKKKKKRLRHKMKDNFPAAWFIACLKCIQH